MVSGVKKNYNAYHNLLWKDNKQMKKGSNLRKPLSRVIASIKQERSFKVVWTACKNATRLARVPLEPFLLVPLTKGHRADP